MNNYNLIQNIAVWTIPVLSAIIVHEVAHGAMAKVLGDPTAEQMGRLNLNPINHIDLFGTIVLPTICLILGSVIFGWAKPVPINYNNLKNKTLDPILVALAGPLSNFLMAIAWSILIKFLIHNFDLSMLGNEKAFFIMMARNAVYLNVFLMLFNLLPIPPLDGSKALQPLLPYRFLNIFYQLENYGFIILLILMYTNILQILLQPALTTIVNALL